MGGRRSEVTVLAMLCDIVNGVLVDQAALITRLDAVLLRVSLSSPFRSGPFLGVAVSLQWHGHAPAVVFLFPDPHHLDRNAFASREEILTGRERCSFGIQ